MKSNDEETQVFIVRLWCEAREIEGAKPVLRGTVEHVSSGERCSVKDLSGVLAFLQPRVEAMNVELEHGVITSSANGGKATD